MTELEPPAVVEARAAQQLGYYVFRASIARQPDGKKLVTFPSSWAAASTLDPAELEAIAGTGAYGIDCGKSGVVGVDLDNHVGGPNGVELWAARGLPTSPLQVTTQAGGVHHYFRTDAAAGWTTAGLGVLGVDIRGDGGLVFGPGSAVAGGGTYVRSAPWSSPVDLPLVPSAVLRELVVENTQRKQQRAANLNPVAFAPVTGSEIEQCRQRAEQSFAVLEASVSGGFNIALNDYCFWVGRLFATAEAAGEDGDFSVDAAQAYIEGRMTASTVMDAPDRNDRQTIGSSGIERGMRQPFTAPIVASNPADLVPPDFTGDIRRPDDLGTPDGRRSDLLNHPWVAKRINDLRIEQEVQRQWTAERFPYAARIEAKGFEPVADVVLKAATAPREFLVDRWLYRGSYGALGAEYKAGKTWLVMDLAVSIAADVPFMGVIPVTSGKVAIMHNEGDMGEFVARLKAVAESKGVELTPERMTRIRVQNGSSIMSDPIAVSRLYDDLKDFEPDLLIIDPWYLSAGDEADGKTLSRVGMVLRNLQGVAGELGAALLITTHWNKSGDGKGFSRWSGAGLQEWGRVLINVGVKRYTAAAAYAQDKTGRTSADLEIELRGQTSGVYQVTRTVWSGDAGKPAAPLHYEVTAAEAIGEAPSSGTDPLYRARERVLSALAKAEGDRNTPIQIGPLLEIVGASNKGRRATGYRDALKQLIVDGMVEQNDTGKKAGASKIYAYSLTVDGQREALESPGLEEKMSGLSGSV